jgi:hypothetical protein
VLVLTAPLLVYADWHAAAVSRTLFDIASVLIDATCGIAGLAILVSGGVLLNSLTQRTPRLFLSICDCCLSVLHIILLVPLMQ